MALLKTLARLDKLIWTFIFGGLLGVVLGLSVGQSDPELGPVFVLVGLLFVAFGASLIYLRARMTEEQPSEPPAPP
jgi:uncharacterized membrane protein HdeD (DUF308 family)